MFYIIYMGLWDSAIQCHLQTCFYINNIHYYHVQCSTPSWQISTITETQSKFMNEASWLELLEFHWIPYEVFLSYYVAWHIRICTFWKIFMVQEIFGQLVQVLYHYWPWSAITNHLLTVRHNHFEPMLHHLHL